MCNKRKRLGIRKDQSRTVKTASGDDNIGTHRGARRVDPVIHN